mmetsp:Transcript_42099/g.134511  ORF Transcript_42099/g.134511 Transcript_42099/m.134511 type:complete len:131 (+) Transcript_42099:220-612(+)
MGKDDDDKESVSSFGGSEAESTTSSGKAEYTEEFGDDADDFMGSRTGYQDALFGILYPLSKSKYTNLRKFAVLMVFLDFIQMSVFLIKPMNQSWDIDYDSPTWWQRQATTRSWLRCTLWCLPWPSRWASC